MNLLSLENISKGYREKNLFEHISFGIGAGEKIGLIGINGTGKSTLLKIIAGLELPDSGAVTKGNSVTIEYLPQNPEFDDQATVLQQVFKGNSPTLCLIRDYEQTLEKMRQVPDDAGLQRRLLSLSQQIDALDAWQMESEAKIVLTKLGIADFAASVGTLSGGQRKRIALASALINPADLLILDEPTNHLDSAAIDWLEQYLNKRQGTLIMVTHDRYFLDRVVQRIMELDNARLYSYAGNYTNFLEKKLERQEQQQATERKRQNLLRNELAWIRKGARARTTKQKARIDRFEILQAEKTELGAREIEISAGTTRLGKKVISLEQVAKAFAGTSLFNDFNYIVARDDRVGIIGANQVGKTTLLKIMAGRLTPDQGRLERGQTVNIGYFGQENSELDERLRVIEYIKEAGEFLTTANGHMISAAKMLERFLFPPNVQWTPIARLSGGEKRRLYLLRVLMGAPNVLLLDEPTNDLDIQTLTILEEYIDEFPGAIIAVSHDRYFLDRMASLILAFEGNGVITQHVGNYSDYLQNLRQLPNSGSINQKDKRDGDKKVSKPEQLKERPRKFTFKEQREYEQIEEIITRAEQELQAVNQRIDEAGSDYLRLQELMEIRQEQERQLEELLERWTYLNERAEEINSDRSR